MTTAAILALVSAGCALVTVAAAIVGARHARRAQQRILDARRLLLDDIDRLEALIARLAHLEALIADRGADRAGTAHDRH